MDLIPTQPILAAWATQEPLDGLTLHINLYYGTLSAGPNTEGKKYMGGISTTIGRFLHKDLKHKVIHGREDYVVGLVFMDIWGNTHRIY